MTKSEYERIRPQLSKDMFVRGFTLAKYLYLDETTRIRLGLSISKLGTVYQLQRKKRRYSWSEVAWSYPVVFDRRTLNEIVDYLFWYEEYTFANFR